MGKPKVPGLVTVATVASSVVKSTSLTVPALGMAETVQLDADPPITNVAGADTVVTSHVGIGVGVGVGMATTTPPVRVYVVLAPVEHALS